MTRLRFVVVVALVLTVGAEVFAAGKAAEASGQFFGTFKTPSGNIICEYASGIRGPLAGVECGIQSGLVGARLAHCSLGDPQVTRVEVFARGRASRVLCAGDPGPFIFTTAPVLPYGRTLSRGGIACSSARDGLTCRNRDAHGFFLSRERWRLF